MYGPRSGALESRWPTAGAPTIRAPVAADTPPNLLYYGDNLDVLRRHVKDESVDLVYLDPPFKSNQDYNVLFAEHGTRSAAQIKAFEDTWRWDEWPRPPTRRRLRRAAR